MISFFRNFSEIASLLREIMDTWDEHGKDVVREIRQLWKEAKDVRKELKDLRTELAEARGSIGEIRAELRDGS